MEAFLDKMPKVYDPFAGGGAIPLEAAHLGCRTYANDVNPVAHIIEKASIEFPQKYGKPITYSKDEFIKIYGEEEFHKQEELKNVFGDNVNIANRLAFDVEYYAMKLLKMTEDEVGYLYPIDVNQNKPIAYYWVKVGSCINPSCKAEVPLLRQFYLCNKKEKKIYLKPVIDGIKINFEIKKGKYEKDGWVNRGNLKCPCCGSITDVKRIKEQSIQGLLGERLVAVIIESKEGKEYRQPTSNELLVIENLPEVIRPSEKMQRNSAGGDTFSWGINEWGQMFSTRQINTMNSLVSNLHKITQLWDYSETEFHKAVITYLATWIDRIATISTQFGVYNVLQEIFSPAFGRQAIAMVLDYPEAYPFTNIGGVSFVNQLELILKIIDEEGKNTFHTIVIDSSSSEKILFNKKSITAVITDPPYYDAIAYADLSDFFYV